ncbi:hypothetical protein [Cellvibrio sp. KY-YJ-3]|uniref:hypothetical protein n=1 Tax=Cellvibrio sp. KY-YJ-3 TaxID=454662 RepID=UPI001249145A|nr:hypothetical protein [Cellvibrio sp. KY-YJ-3]QEY14042.1 hypothetical protein D0B88_18310 [Cellvibrio sp. KY-YJ-3]
MKFFIVLAANFLLVSLSTFATEVNFSRAKLTAVDVSYSLEDINGVKAIKVVKNPKVTKFDEPTFVRIQGTDFKDGTIEVKVLSRLLADAPDFARGFIGIAFRINNENSAFESIYVRPTNGRSDDIKRRNHATQYFSYPDFKFDRLRSEFPGRYESPADIGLNEWIQLKIVATGQRASLFINNADTPALIVDELKRGADTTGAIGLWVDVGTDGYFSDLRVYR